MEERLWGGKRHYTMQMIWLLGALASAKKVHFNLNGSELRGFPIKARSGQSNILYANPLAPKAAACFCLCPAVITRGQCASGSCLSKWTTTWSDQATLHTTTASTPVISAARFAPPPPPHRQNTRLSSHLIICRESCVLLLRDIYVPEGQWGQIDRWDTRACTLNDYTALPDALPLDAVTIIACCGQTAVFKQMKTKT